MKAMLIPTGGKPTLINVKQDADGSTLHDLQRLSDERPPETPSRDGQSI